MDNEDALELIGRCSGGGFILGCLPGTLCGCCVCCQGGMGVAVGITLCLTWSIDGALAANALLGVTACSVGTAVCIYEKCKKDESVVPAQQNFDEPPEAHLGEPKFLINNAPE